MTRKNPIQTLSPTAFTADPVHAVVPVAGAEKRQSVVAPVTSERSMARQQCSYRSDRIAGRFGSQEDLVFSGLRAAWR